MKKTTITTNEAKVFKTFDGVDLTTIPGSATEILTTNWDKFNRCKTSDDVIALCHELFDDAGLSTEWTNKFFYTLDQIVERNPNPRKAFEQTMYYVSNARLRGAGLGMNPRRYYETEDGKKYTKKQICEAIAYWKSVLESLDD